MAIVQLQMDPEVSASIRALLAARESRHAAEAQARAARETAGIQAKTALETAKMQAGSERERLAVERALALEQQKSQERMHRLSVESQEKMRRDDANFQKDLLELKSRLDNERISLMEALEKAREERDWDRSKFIMDKIQKNRENDRRLSMAMQALVIGITGASARARGLQGEYERKVIEYENSLKKRKEYEADRDKALEKLLLDPSNPKIHALVTEWGDKTDSVKEALAKRILSASDPKEVSDIITQVVDAQGLMTAADFKAAEKFFERAARARTKEEFGTAPPADVLERYVAALRVVRRCLMSEKEAADWFSDYETERIGAGGYTKYVGPVETISSRAGLLTGILPRAKGSKIASWGDVGLARLEMFVDAARRKDGRIPTVFDVDEAVRTTIGTEPAAPGEPPKFKSYDELFRGSMELLKEVVESDPNFEDIRDKFRLMFPD